MSKIEFITYCIQHDADYPDLEQIDLQAAQAFLDRLDPTEDLPAITAQEFMDMWNAGIQNPAIMEE